MMRKALPIHPSFPPPIHPSIPSNQFTNPFTHPPTHQLAHPSRRPPIHAHTHPCTHPSMHPPIHAPIHLSIHPSIHPPILAFIYEQSLSAHTCTHFFLGSILAFPFIQTRYDSLPSYCTDRVPGTSLLALLPTMMK